MAYAENKLGNQTNMELSKRTTRFRVCKTGKTQRAWTLKTYIELLETKTAAFRDGMVSKDQFVAVRIMFKIWVHKVASCFATRT